MRNEDQEYFSDPEFLENFKKYEAMMKGGPSVFLDADELTDIAEYYLIKEENEEGANACINYALALYPEATAPLIFQARQHLLKDDLDTTQTLCDAIPDQEDREVIFLNAEIMVRREQAQAAIEYLLARGKNISEDYDYYLYDAAYIFMDYNEFEAANDLAERLKNYAPDWYKTWQIMADSLLGLNRFNKALLFINKMLDQDPFSVETWNWASEAYSGIEKFEKAVEAADYALAIDPTDPRAMQLKGHAFLHMDLYEQALSQYEQVLDATPNDETTMAFMAYTYLCMNELGKAKEIIEEAEKLCEPDSPDLQLIYEQHANVLAALECFDEALFYLDKAEAIGGNTPNDYDAIRADLIRRREEKGK